MWLKAIASSCEKNAQELAMAPSQARRTAQV
jgi:hypothetical protein